MPEQTPLERAAKLIREVDSSSECASEFACDIRIVATALIERETLQAARIAELTAQLAQRDKALAAAIEAVGEKPHNFQCDALGKYVFGQWYEYHVPRPDLCDCWKADILTALDQKEPGA